MAIQVLEKIYEGSTLSSVTSNLIYFRLPVDCDISEIRLIGTGFNSGLGDWLFNVSLAGANLFSGSGRITFNSGDNDVTKTGLTESGSQGDIVVLNLESIGAGVIQTPITLLMTIDDGLSSGGGSTHLPDIAPTSPNAFDDEFTAGTLDAKWTQYGASDLTNTFANGSYEMSRLSNSNGFSGIYQAIPSGAWDWVTKVIVPQGITSGDVDFSLAIFDNAASTSDPIIISAIVDTAASTFNLPGIFKFTNRTTFGTTLESASTNTRNSDASAPYSVIYLRVKRNGNAYNFYRSINGVVWVEIGTGIADITAHFTPNHLGLLVRNTSGATRKVAFVDWTRIYTTLPVFMGG